MTYIARPGAYAGITQPREASRAQLGMGTLGSAPNAPTQDFDRGARGCARAMSPLSREGRGSPVFTSTRGA